jgi:hypothetical protein
MIGVVDLIDPKGSATPEPIPAARHRRKYAIAVVAVLAVLLTVGVMLERWRNGLHMFGAAGNEVGADRMAVGRTFYAPEVSWPTDTPLTLTVPSIRPDIADNTAHATVRVLLCNPRPGLTTGLGTAWSLTRYCSGLHEFIPGSYRLCHELSPNCVMFFLAVTAHTSGHVHIDGVRIHYENGFRHGDQLIGIAIDTTTP